MSSAWLISQKCAWLFFVGAFTIATTTAEEAEGQRVQLRYQLQPGEKLHYEVTHTAKTKTKINGQEEVSDMHTVSRRHWDVQSVDGDVMSFDHVLDSVEMTQATGDAEPVRWDSREEAETPAPFTPIADKIGGKLSTIAINTRGQEKNREADQGNQTDLGMGSMTIPMPEEPVAVGGSWSVPRQVRVRTEDGEMKVIKIRELYTLEKVKTGVATLSIRSEPLTPIDSQSVQAQVVQQMSNGTIRFDIDKGRMLEKKLDWDENVVSFRGPNSAMQYRATLTERLVPGSVLQQATKETSEKR